MYDQLSSSPDFESNLGTDFAKTPVKTNEYSTARTPLTPDEGGGNLQSIGSADVVAAEQIFGLLAD